MNRNSKLYECLMAEGRKATPRLEWKAQSVKSHKAWRRIFRAKLLSLLGHRPEPVPLKVEWAERVEKPSFIRHKVYIRTESKYWTPAYYFVPRNLLAARPAVICLHGHSGVNPYIREGSRKEKQLGKEHELDMAPFLAEKGYIAIAPVIRGWNETLHEADPTVSVWGNSCYRMAMDSFLLGKTPMGVRSWDCMRVLDFLLTQREVNHAHIGVAGLSGGGTLGMYFAATDDRVQFAMLGGAFCTYQESIYEIFHCICNCVPNIMEYADMSDVMAVFAPRPLLVISGKTDPIFPIKATRKAVRKLEETYALLDGAANIETDFFDGGHQWSNRRTLPFLARHTQE